MWTQGTDAPDYSRVTARVQRAIEPFLQSIPARKHLELAGGWCFARVWAEALKDATGIEMLQQPLGVFDGHQILGFYTPGYVVMHEPFMDAFPQHPKRTFAVYHEVAGHALNHEYVFAGRDRPAKLEDTERSLCPTIRYKLEREANAAAAIASAPMKLIKAALEIEREKGNGPYVFRGPAHYDEFSSRSEWIENYPEYCRRIGKTLGAYFDGLSAESLGYRLCSGDVVAVDHDFV